MSEKSIIAFFQTPEQAERVETKLKSLRAADTEIKRVSRYQGEGVGETINPLTGDFPGLGYLSLGADFNGPSARVLGAADVSASGMSDGGQGGPTGHDVMLTAVMDESVYEQAMKVVREAGAIV